MAIRTLRLWSLIAVLFFGTFSAQPSINLAILDFPSFRIGLYQIAILLLITTSLPLLPKYLSALGRERYYIAGGTLLLLMSIAAGLVLSEVPLRTMLYTLSFLTLIALGIGAAVGFYALNERQRRIFITSGMISGIVVSALSVGQLVMATLYGQSAALLCNGCHADVFGFPRINLFAAEPQFLASSLLPAFFLAFFYSVSSKLARWSLLLSSLAIALTFSRGAIIAVVIGILTTLATSWIRRDMQRHGRAILISLAGCVIGFGLLITSSIVNHPTSRYITHNTIVSMLEQLSLGVISIPQKTATKGGDTPQATVDDVQQPTSDFQPAGLVEASSNDRIEAARLALSGWSSSLRTVLFGTGLGNLGAYLQRQGYAVPNDQTVYIMYILLLSAIGLVGILPLLAVLMIGVWRYRKPTAPWGMTGLALLIAISVHFWFFGSLINAAHCFAWIGVLLYDYRDSYAKKLRSVV